MIQYSQFQNLAHNHHLYSELQNTLRNHTDNTEKNHSEHEYFMHPKISAKPNRINQSLQSEMSQDLLKEVKAKNDIMSAQLEEYKFLVVNMQKKIGQLKQQNKALNEKLTILAKQKQIINKVQEKQKASLMQTVPLHNLLKQQKNQESSMSCYQIKQILAKFQQNIYQIGHTKRQVEKYLAKMVQQKHQMQNFVDNLWQLKDKIEPGNQQYLYQLWRWVKIVAINYSQLKQYKNTRDQKLNKKERH